MAKVALVLSLAALLLAGWTAYDRHVATSSTHADTVAAAPVPDERLAALERRLAALEGRPALAEARPAGASLARPSAADAHAAVPDLERRIAALEATDKKVRELLPIDGGNAEAGRLALAQSVETPEHVVNPIPGPMFLGSVDDAAKQLDLTPAQKADLERIAADANRRIEELKKIPDEEGKTWADAETTSLEVPGGQGALRVMFGSNDKVRAFREKTIPGRNESFGAAERKIVADAKSQVRSGLSPDQQKKWDAAKTESLFGGDGGDTFSMVTFFETKDGGTTIPVPPDSAPAK
jgi:hypothetical protein